MLVPALPWSLSFRTSLPHWHSLAQGGKLVGAYTGKIGVCWGDKQQAQTGRRDFQGTSRLFSAWQLPQLTICQQPRYRGHCTLAILSPYLVNRGA